MEQYAKEREERKAELAARKERDIERRKARKNRHAWAQVEEKETE